jgi:hypothetical protein
MQKWLGVAAFHKKLSRHDRISYKKILGYVDAEILPTFPRYGQERYRIKFCRELIQFLIDRGLDEGQIKDILTGWDS